MAGILNSYNKLRKGTLPNTKANLRAFVPKPNDDDYRRGYIRRYFAQPANDLICNAVTVTCGNAYSGTTIGATNSGAGESSFCVSWNQNTPGVWYKFIGNGNSVTFSLCGTAHDSELAIYTGTCTAPSCYAANDDNGPACGGLSSSIAITTVVDGDVAV